MKKISLVAYFLVTAIIVFSQSERWQQKIKYNINVKMDVLTNRFAGTEKIEYSNNSTDTLKKVFFHLYWNAFQPNSVMDIRSRELGKNMLTSRRGDQIPDWDARVKDRIQNLKKLKFVIIEFKFCVY